MKLDARVYFIFNNGTPEQPSARQAASRKQDYLSLDNKKVAATYPFNLQKAWIAERDSIQKWPP